MILRGYYNSEILHTTENIEFIVPDNSESPCRVVYLLHGLHGNHGTWNDYTMLPYYGKKHNALFVIPEVGRSFYSNQKYGRKYFDFLSEELPRISKRIFNISTRREDTAVMGCSMGGYGALKLALSKPKQIGFCGAIATACVNFKSILDGLREDADSYRNRGSEEAEILTDLYAIYGDDLEYQPENDISALIHNFPVAQPKPIIYAACGTEDDLLEDNRKLKDALQEKSFDCTYEECSGSHEWYFFNDALKKTLEFWYKR